MSSRKGKQYGENSLKYDLACCMCARSFPSTRPDARTCTASCRSALRRWVKRYGELPREPPGRFHWLNSFEGRRAERELKQKQDGK